MNIAVDGSHFNYKSMSGTQVYLYNLLYHLSLIDSKNNYIMYTQYDMPGGFWAEMTNANHNFTFVKREKCVSWTQVSLSSSILKTPPEVLICPWQTMPIVHKPHTKVLSIIHGLEYKRMHFGPTLYTSLFSNRIICVSNFTKKAVMKAFKVPENKIATVYEGVDTEFFKKRSILEIREKLLKYNINTEYMFFVGTVVPRKNILGMLKAFFIFLENNPECALKFVIAGNISKSCEEVYELVNSSKFKGSVMLLGRVSQDDLPMLISGAKFLAYVSLSEGFGLPVLEAMSCGVPVLTSTQGALPEVGGNAAYYVNPLDSNHIASGIAELYYNNDLCSELVSLGYENIKKFSWYDAANAVLKEVEALKR